MADTEETPTQRQARLRRERRNAKIQAGGSARLAAIMNSSGREHAAEAESARPLSSENQVASTPRSDGTATPDPEITDIAQHAYEPRTTNRAPTSGFPSGAQAQQMPQSEDPMMAMLQQMLGGAGAGRAHNAGEGPNPQMPPDLANLFASMGGGGGGMPPMPGQEQAEQAAPSSSAYLWRVLHFFVALLISLYVTFNTTFTGSKRARDLSYLTYTAPLSLERNFGTRLFYLFATAEVVLQSSRYLMEKGQLRGGGMMGTLSQILPPPWNGYVRTLGRYSIIWSTLVSDAMVVVFILGAMAWWRGGAEYVSAS